MPLTMTPERFEGIRRLVQDRKIAREAAQVDWSRQPGFRSIDELFAYLDAAPQPGSADGKRTADDVA